MATDTERGFAGMGLDPITDAEADALEKANRAKCAAIAEQHERAAFHHSSARFHHREAARLHHAEERRAAQLHSDAAWGHGNEASNYARAARLGISDASDWQRGNEVEPFREPEQPTRSADEQAAPQGNSPRSTAPDRR
jgi:hypothetical protein